MSLGLAAGLIIFLLSLLRLFDGLELKTLNWRLQLRGEKTPKSDIAIVFVEEKYRKGLSRGNYAVLVKKYRGASAIGFDLVLDEHNNDEDGSLETASNAATVYYAFGKRIKGTEPYYEGERENRVKALEAFKWGKINAAYEGKLERLERDEIVAPLPQFSSVAQGVGHIYAATNPKEVLRKIPLLIEYEGNFYPLLSLQMACDKLGLKKEPDVYLGKYIKLDTEEKGIVKIPIDEKGYMFINYVGRFEKFEKTYSLSQILGENAPVASDIILVGPMMREEKQPLEDSHRTPFGEYPGVGIHANIIESILQDDFLHRAGTPQKCVVLLLLGLMMGGVAGISGKRGAETSWFFGNFCGSHKM